MVPNVAKRGTSFKGAAAYYLHDKRQEGEQERTTTERIDWTHTRGLMTDDPDFAVRLMAATAMDKDRLKEAAGVRKTGNKSKGDVYAYSIAWHPDEKGKFDKAQMLEAADQSIKALGAQDHQALIVAHNDEPHPHVHVIINLVHPETGKNLSLSNDRKKLDKWAYEYRRARGEENLYCPKRTAKHEAIEAQKRGEEVDFVRGDRSKPRSTADSFNEARQHANQNDLRGLEADQARKDLELSAYGRKLASKHKHEWAALSDNYRLKKRHISEQYRKDKQALKDEIFEQGKPYYAQMMRQQRNEEYKFKQREKRLSGKLQNMVEAVKLARASGRDEDSSILTMAFNFFSGKARRLQWLKNKHKKQVQAFKADQRAYTRQAVADLNERRGQKAVAAREQFGLDRQALIHRQRDERTDLQQRWKVRNEQKKRALKMIAEKGRAEAADDAVLTQDEVVHAREEFKRKAKRQRRSRSRSRKRERD